MKKVCLVLCPLLVVALVICVQQRAGVAQQLSTPTGMVEISEPDYSDSLGFKVENYPNGGGILLDRCWLVNNSIAQLDFTFEPQTAGNLRIAIDTGAEISDRAADYYENVHTEDYGGIKVRTAQTPGGAALLHWRNGGFSYALYFSSTQMGMVGGVTGQFMEQLKVVSAGR